MPIHLNCKAGTGKPAARIGDSVRCPIHGDTSIVSGSPDVRFNRQSAARVGDTTGCGDTIIEGSPSVNINGQAAAFLGCATAHGGKITSGSPTVFIGTSAERVADSLFEFDEQFCLVHEGTDVPIAHHRYRITSSDGQV